MIFNVQLARITRLLRPTFDFVILDAPFVGQPGPGILPFFEDCGPYAYWTHPERNGNKNGTGIEGVMYPEVVAVIMAAIRQVEVKGGEVVGAWGFSQGSRVVAGLLKTQEEAQRRESSKDQGLGGLKTRLKFGVSFMGSYPPPLVPLELHQNTGNGEDENTPMILEQRITTPTLYVQGVNDTWNWAGKKMFGEYYDANTAVMVNVQTEHHMPISTDENEMVKNEILKMWNETK